MRPRVGASCSKSQGGPGCGREGLESMPTVNPSVQVCCQAGHLLPSASLPCSVHDKWMNPRQAVGFRKGLYSGASWWRRWQASSSKWPSCPGLVARFFYGSELGEEVRKQSKKMVQSLQMSSRMASPRQGDVLVSLPYSPSQVGGSGYLLEAGHYVCL